MADDMAGSLFYHRRNDRSPEKSEFYKLPNQDKQLISHLRSVMDTARGNVTKLRDDVEDKERDLSRETALRKAAESRLEQLVDMYGDPSVNDELRQRLPRANKHGDPRKQAQEELDRLGRRDEDGDRTRSRSAEGERRSRRRFRSASIGSDGEGGRSRSHSPPRSRSRRHDYPYMYPPMYPPYAMYPGYVMPGMVPPGMMPNQGFSPAQAPQQANQMFSIPQMPFFTYPGAGATNNFGASQFNQSGSFLHKDLGAKNSDDSKSEGAQREQKRQILLLVNELDQQRALNKKLMDQLGELQREIGSIKMNNETSDAAAAATDKMGKISDMIEEIYRGQQKRDAAVMGRLRVANEERDEALFKLKRLQEADQGAAMEDIDGTIANILGSYADEAVSSATQHVDNVADVIRLRRQRRRDVTNEEMTAILKDRDIYFNKCKELESEVLKLQRINRARTADSTDQHLLQAKLLTTQQERDVAVMKMQKLEDELQSLKLYYGLHKSLSPKGNLQENVQDTIKTLKGQLQDTLQGHLQDDLQALAKDKLKRPIKAPKLSQGDLVTQLRDALAERDNTTSELRKARSETRDAKENAKKLERLVNVLRRKINGLGSKVED